MEAPTRHQKFLYSSSWESVCVSWRIQLSNSALPGCQSKRGKDHQEQHADACETPKRMQVQHQSLPLHCIGVWKSWRDSAVGGKFYLWVLELKLQPWPWGLSVTPAIVLSEQTGVYLYYTVAIPVTAVLKHFYFYPLHQIFMLCS